MITNTTAVWPLNHLFEPALHFIQLAMYATMVTSYSWTLRLLLLGNVVLRIVT